MRVGIIGAGIFGIAAALELRARGHEVVVFEQGEVPNERASSTDVSKTIRRAYGDNATYVELVERAAPRWRAWQEQLGETFYWQIGQIQIERDLKPGHRVHDSYEYLSRRGREVRLLSISEARTRFPQFTYGDGDICVFDPWAGYIASGQAVAALARLARGAGTTIRSNARVREVAERAGGMELALDEGALHFDRALVAVGVWLARLIPSLGAHVRPTFQEMVFFEPADRESFAPGPLPVWAINVEEEGWYGHPLGAQGWVKVANDLRGPVVDPDAPRQVTPEFVAAARAFVARRIPALAEAPIVGGRACLYENTPDHDFVIDWAPGFRGVLVAGGGSGHGFKFGGSIGPVIADALEDRANPLGDLFRIGRRFG